MAFEVPFHRHHFLRLVLERVEAVHVAREYLQRGHDGRHPHRHREHLSRVQIGAVLEQVPRTDPAHDEGRRQVSGHDSVHQAVREAGIEHDVPPARPGQELSVGSDLVTRRRLHPAVHRQDPEGRHESAERHHAGRCEMQLLADLVHAEQHDTEEARFEEECRQHLVSHERSDHGPCHIGKDRPVRAELVTHHDPRNDAHRKGDGEYLQPVFEQVEIDLPPGFQPQAFEHHEVTCQPDRKRREEEMETHREGELDARKHQSIEKVEHETALHHSGQREQSNKHNVTCLGRNNQIIPRAR